jgi:CRP-like cAMP-binding protein
VNKTARLLRFTKLLKLMRLVRVRRILERYEQVLGVLHSTAGNSFQVFKLTAGIFLGGHPQQICRRFRVCPPACSHGSCVAAVGHILCCFWFLVGEDELHSDCTPDGSESCVRTEGWISSKGMKDENTFDQYLMSLYWGMTTMTTVGYGDISAATRAEQIYCIAAMLIGGFMFGIIIGSLSNIIASASPLESNKKSRLAEISEWLQLRAVPVHLRRDIYEYYRTLYTEGSETGLDEREILRELPHQMAKPLIKHMFTSDKAVFDMQCWKMLRLHTLPYFTQVEVALALRPLHMYAHHTYSSEAASNKGCVGCIRFFQKKVAYDEAKKREEGVIFEEGVDDDRSIYIVQEGMVDITQKDPKDPTKPPKTARLLKGDCFGESCLLYIDDDAKYSRNYSAFAATDCNLLMLNREAINSLPDAAIECLKPLAMRRQERIHAKAIEKLREEGIIFDEVGNAITDNSDINTSEAAMITTVRTLQTTTLSMLLVPSVHIWTDSRTAFRMTSAPPTHPSLFICLHP